MASRTNPYKPLGKDETVGQSNDVYKRTILVSLILSWTVFAVVFGLLLHWDIFEDAAFFKVDMNDPDRQPEVLDVPISDMAKQRFFIFFFFTNAFLSEWNGVVIASIFGKMEVGSDGGVYSKSRVKLFALFLVYDRESVFSTLDSTPTVVQDIRLILCFWFHTNALYTDSFLKKRLPVMYGPVNMTRKKRDSPSFDPTLNSVGCADSLPNASVVLILVILIVGLCLGLCLCLRSVGRPPTLLRNPRADLQLAVHAGDYQRERHGVLVDEVYVPARRAQHVTPAVWDGRDQFGSVRQGARRWTRARLGERCGSVKE